MKSGKDYHTHSALNRLISIDEYGIRESFVLSNSGNVEKRGGITYLPVYYAMFL